MSVTTNDQTAVEWRWLRSAQFDAVLVLGLPLLSIAVIAAIAIHPALFLPILIADLWLLGYHHVISTYTRICFDRESFRKNGILLWGLLPAVIVGTIGIAWFVGVWIIVSIYFYWQWFHYVRQSWGISRAYRGRQPDADYDHSRLDQAVFWSLPTLGILHRSHQDPGTFIGLDLRMIPVPGWLVTAATVATISLLAYWLIRRLAAAREGRLNTSHTLYMLTHFFVFAVAYIAIPEISVGWLFINIWHNAQYILFVWMFNNKRFKTGVDPQARFLSYISQNGRIGLYLLACITITGVIYWLILGTLQTFFVNAVGATIVLYQIVNFHHYMVDSMIWKVRSGDVKKTLSVNG